MSKVEHLLQFETKRSLINVNEIRKIIADNFSWLEENDGVIINAGSTVGGNLGHDLDVVIILDEHDPEKIFTPFSKSIDSISAIIEENNRFIPSFSFSRVAWQDFIGDLRRSSAPNLEEPLGIHFLWYSSPEQLLISEPRGLALGLVNGDIIRGNEFIANLAKSVSPSKATCDQWRGIDNVLDPIRLIANPNIELEKLSPTIGHTIERFVIWDLLAERVRQNNGSDLVTREDIKNEVSKSEPILISVLDRAKLLRDRPAMFDRPEILRLAKDIIENWNQLRRHL